MSEQDNSPLGNMAGPAFKKEKPTTKTIPPRHSPVAAIFKAYPRTVLTKGFYPSLGQTINASCFGGCTGSANTPTPRDFPPRRGRCRRTKLENIKGITMNTKNAKCAVYFKGSTVVRSPYIGNLKKFDAEEINDNTAPTYA